MEKTSISIFMRNKLPKSRGKSRLREKKTMVELEKNETDREHGKNVEQNTFARSELDAMAQSYSIAVASESSEQSQHSRRQN